ncbi:hypothetical protein MKW94_004536 [Papaver nudicaule]|uniref:Response regulatory domain-containing protein n=1 Tax=Papaver nudicaule TaxID=74823 RepID=A0AA41VQU4_PAPNU|nr:hypothetical protein [Papaver nudicaule]
MTSSSGYVDNLKSPPVSIGSLISTIKEEEGYPAGLKVLVVDEELEFLNDLEDMLRKSNYIGTMCSSASQALSMLQDKSLKFDIILMAIVSDLDVLKEIRRVALEADLPISYILPKDTSMYDAEVVSELVGANGSKLFKPVRLRDVQCIWYLVVEKRKQNIRKFVKEDIIDGWEGSVISKLLYSRWGDDGSLEKLIKLIQEVEEEEEDSMNLEDHDNSLYPNKKPKIQQGEDHMDVRAEKHYASLFLNSKRKIPWMASKLHEQFITAVYQLGTQKAKPAEILQRMGSPVGITRKDVAIHLKEFRFLREAFVGGHPSTMPYNEKAKPLYSSLTGYTDDVNIWRKYCGSFYALSGDKKDLCA